MSNPAEQGALYARLQEVLGPEPAATLMTMLPSGDQLASKADIGDVESGLKADIADLRSELKGDIADLRSEIKEELRDIRGMIRSYDEALRGYVRTFVVAQVATVVGVTGIVLGIERLA